jgi:hypothetical protein
MMVCPIPPGESVTISIRQILEGFDLVTITNIGDGALAITSVGIWYPALSMGHDFGATRMPADYPFPGYAVTLAPGEVVTYPILVSNIVWSLEERQGQVVDFVYYVGTDHNTRHVSEPVSVEAYLRALDPNPLARTTLPDGGVFQA